MSMKRWKKLILVLVALAVRNLAIPAAARHDNNPLKASPEILNEARDSFVDRCAVCHGNDGSGQTQVGRNLYPKPPDLRLPQTQNLTDGQIRYIIKNGVRLTGMPAWSHPHEEQDNDSWKLVLHPRPAPTISRGEIGVASDGRLRALHGLAGLRKMPPANLRAMEEDAHGQRRPRSP